MTDVIKCYYGLRNLLQWGYTAKALAYYHELKELYHNYPVKGEADMELMIGDWIKERTA